MRRTLQSAILLGLSSLAGAVFQDEVGDIDFHYSLVGLPQVETTFFHRPRKDDKASLLYTLGDVGVVGAINPSNGELVWRQHISDGIANGGGHLRAPEGENWVASAHGSKVQAWNALTGRNIWTTEFKGVVKDLEILELTETPRKDVLVLFDEDGVTVLRRLHGAIGSVVWEFRETSKDLPVQVSTNIANIYLLSLHGSPGSYSLKVTALDTAAGTRLDHWSVGNKCDIHGPEQVMFVGANSAAPIAAWASRDLAKLSFNVLGMKNKQEFALPDGTESLRVHAPHLLQSLPHFLLHIRTRNGHKAQVYHTDLKSGHVSRAYELPHVEGPGAFSTSSDAANVYFTRITADEISIVSSESHGLLARWPCKSTDGHVAVHAVSEVIKKAGGKEFAIRSAAVTDGDDWVLTKNGQIDWTRPEGLSGAVAAVWAEIPEAERLAQVLAEEAHANPVTAYLHRVNRHVTDLAHLPAYLAGLPQRILDGVFGADLSGHRDGPHRDTFGFSKLVVVATSRGRFYGLDTGHHGQMLWSRAVFNVSPGESLVIRGIATKDAEGVVTVVGSNGEYATIESATGKILKVQQAGSFTKVASTAVIDDGASRWLLPLGANGLPVPTMPLGTLPNDTVVLRDGSLGVKGVKFIAKGGEVIKDDIWHFHVSKGQRIVDIATRPSHDPISSIGRVLGDRKVAYKYLNPNTIVVAAIEEATNTLSVHLLDIISGQLLASQVYNGVDSTKSPCCAMAENWYACTFFGDYAVDDGADRRIKGFHVAVSDLYESPEPNDRGPLGDAAEFSSLNPVDAPTGVPLPHVVSQAYVFSERLTSLSVTQTRQGITSRQLLAYLPDSNSILAVPRHVIDPRRPVDRDPTSAEMEAEALTRYTPQFEIDGRGIVSHELDVLGVREILATPAAVESTSLLFAYGVDIFGTRAAPSGVFDILGKGFNKVTLVGTVLALFAGVIFLAPVVRRKQIDRRWEAFL
ncbi:uncharacterized protein MAM_00307 [Metarhizium album ARSEF 1941]|uniref:ER membrane protein complex subunit 1 n=1 Tax=Metarhizium album (strain ARSEF 1941) TaxID=1081103 RepID=A0A0B2X7Q2_METAS|nr:uncharacterized protein MAM_00307 [Metarhizium album ARSEF 1941]KHO01306.1 hypothetical protein MAM_00307 [Metarhizium album ARSEF 1941]